MVKFLIKKSFFGGWDNLIPQFLYNIACMALIALFLFLDNLCEECELLIFIPLMAVFILAYCFLDFGIGGITHNWSKFDNAWAKGFGDAIKNHIPHIFLFFAFCIFAAINIIILIPYYLNSMTFFGAFIGFVQIWVTIILGIGMQYYIPLCMFLENEKPVFIFKQCFALAFDNKLFTLFVSVRTVFDFFISALSFFFIPGLTYVSLSHMDAVNLLHQRYKWASEHNIPKKNVNIKEMLEEEESNIGKRTLRDFFRPWKNEK